jgi:hypothetical protein
MANPEQGEGHPNRQERRRKTTGTPDTRFGNGTIPGGTVRGGEVYQIGRRSMRRQGNDGRGGRGR